MKLEPFEMERLQSTYEHQVEFNLSESGVNPVTLGELVDDGASRAALLAESLRYTQTNGTRSLRESIAASYPGATADHVQVTNGGAEANYITTWNLVEPGDEVVMMVPNFMQAWGLARAFGAEVKPWPLAAPDKDGRIQFVGTIPIENVKPGQYSVRAVALQGKDVAESETPVTLVP